METDGRGCWNAMIWFVTQMLNSIRDCFVTGKWEEGQDAATLLKEDGKRRPGTGRLTWKRCS